MNNHRKHHDDVRPHVCSVCGRTFRRPYTLNVHMRSHTNHCPYTCKFCGKQFRHNVTLQVMPIGLSFCFLSCCFEKDCYQFHLFIFQTHERAHTSYKPHACTHCEYRSTAKGNLNKHMMRVHCKCERNFLQIFVF